MSTCRRRCTREEKLEIVNLALEPNTYVDEIAKQLGLHANTIYKRRRAFQNMASTLAMSSTGKKHVGMYPVELMSRVLGVSSIGYYEWCK